MSDFLTVAITGNAQEHVEYARDHMANWVKMATGDKAHELAERTKAEFPSYMNVITGTTRKSIGAFVNRKGKHTTTTSSWYVRAGLGVTGSLNYLGRWTDTDKDFWHGTFNGWRMSADIEGYIGRKVEEHWNGLK